jgi:hypothetical protein
MGCPPASIATRLDVVVDRQLKMRETKRAAGMPLLTAHARRLKEIMANPLEF